jgi:hypothetical protein
MGADLAEILEQERMSCPRVRPRPAVRLSCQGIHPLLPGLVEMTVPSLLLLGLWGLNTGEEKIYKDGYLLAEKTIAMDCQSH